MMLAFITSLRHPANAADYARVEQLLSETLASVAGQGSDDFIVIVVGNRAPAFPLPPRVRFVEVDFAPPTSVNGPHAARDGFVKDKGTKIGIGLIAAREYAPTHVMIFDADDFVSDRLAGFVANESPTRAWYVDSGWMYSRQRNAYRPIEDFNRTCGTSFIVPFGVYGVPDALTTDATQDELVEAFGERLPRIMGGHRAAVEWHREQGNDLVQLPFRGAVYHVDTGENHSGKSLSGIAFPVTPRFRREFAVPSTRGAVSTLWSALGPTAIAETVRNKLAKPSAPAPEATARVGS